MASIAHPQPQAHVPVIGAPRIAETGLWSWLTTIDHKRIGLLYGVSAFLMFLLGGLEALVIRTQLIRPENDLVSAQKYNELFTMHGTTMIFLVIMPLSSAFFNYIVPLQIGARDVAFPRLNAFSYWVFLAGAIILNLPMIASLPGTFAHIITGALGAIGIHAFDGLASWLNGIPLATAVPDQGWYGYAPLTERLFSGHQIDFWALGIQVLGVASVAAALNFIITIFNLRCPGMTMMRLPIFTWATLITSILIVMAFPAITVGLALLTFDRFVGTQFFSAYNVVNGQLITAGGDPILWQHLFWVFGHPEVYILILPAFGIVSEIIPVFSRKPLFGYAVMVYALAAIAFLGFGVWVHHMFTTGLGPTPDSVFAGSTMLIAIPTGVKIFNWLGTMWGGSLRFTTAMLFAVGLVSQFVIGGLSGVMHAVVPVDTQHNDSYFVVAHFHYVLFGGSMFALFGAMYYWWPKFTGRMLDERVGRLHFWLTFAGFNLTFFPMHFLGLAGMPRRYSTYGIDSGWWFWNVISSIGALLIGLSVLVFLRNVTESLRRPKTAGDNPWDGATLEWATTSPPPPYNFREIPVIQHRDPLWVAKYGRESHAREQELDVTVAGLHVGTTQVPDESPAAEAARAVATATDDSVHIHMPNPSYYPLLVAFGMFCAATGLLFVGPWLTIGLLSLPWLSIIGLVIVMAATIGWSFEPAS
jgi:cytochrome c oxidase subunit I